MTLHTTARACIRHAYASYDACQQTDLLVLEGALHAHFEKGRINMQVCMSILFVSGCEVTLTTTCLGLQ